MKALKEEVLYKKHSSVRVGGLNRLIIEYSPKEDPLSSIGASNSLWLKIKNVEALPLRAAYLMGPFILYADVRAAEFDHRNSCFITADQPLYEPNVQAGQSFYAELSVHTIKEKYIWVVDIASQILFTDTTEVNFEVLVGTSKRSLEKIDRLIEDGYQGGEELKVQFQDTVDLWNSPAPDMEKPIHLVVATHGLFSNVGADMHFMKESIDKMARKTGENIMVKGYQGNVCKTEKGVRFLGKGVADFIIQDLMVNYPSIKKISFIGHSLGGLTQTYAIAYIAKHHPEFFKKVKPINFVTLASPFLGIANENPAYVKLSLTMGVVGRTGQDLGLVGSSPLLLDLPKEPTHSILKLFKHRTIYANALHDGIVPLRTSALLYLDWRGLAEVTNARRHDNTVGEDKTEDLVQAATETDDEANDSVAQIPETDYDQKGTAANEMLPYLSSKVLSPFQAMLSLCAPMVKQDEHQISKYKRYQTVRADETEESGPKKLKAIPKSSMIQSATSVLLAPLPPKKFICDPSSREEVILHDKIYTEADLPPPHHLTKSSSMMSQLNPDARFHRLEEAIARAWHKDLAWRKVLVNLKPDAHNNIIVRRRFANAFGWEVIDHLVENHFAIAEEDTQEDEAERSRIQDEDISEQPKNHGWINNEEQNDEEQAFSENEEDEMKLDGQTRSHRDLTNEMIMSGYYN